MTELTMLELADAVEKAAGPDRALDVEVFRAIGAPVPFQFASAMVALTYDEASRNYTAPIGDMRVRYEVPAYTGSAEAAAPLIPEGWEYSFTNCNGYDEATLTNYTIERTAWSSGTSLGRAITAVALRALHTLNLENARG